MFNNIPRNNILASISKNNIINIYNYCGSYILEVPLIKLNGLVVLDNCIPPPLVNNNYNNIIMNDIEKQFYNSVIYIMNSSNTDIEINDYRDLSNNNCKKQSYNIMINNNININKRSIMWLKNTKISFTFIKLTDNLNGWLYSG